MNTGGVTYKQGLVTEAKPGFCRVRFDDIDGLVSAWLPVIHHKTQDDKVIWTLDIGEHVACLMDDEMANGCIVGAIYSEADTPPVASADKFRIQFKDGGSFEYDRSSGAMSVVCKGVANLTAGGAATVKAPTITLDTPEATCTGKLTVQGLLTYQGGMSGSGGAGGAAASIQGSIKVTGGDVQADTISLKNHKTSQVQGGNGTSGAPVP